MNSIAALLVLIAANGSNKLEQITCRDLTSESGLQHVLCAEHWKKGSVDKYYLSLRDESHKDPDGNHRLLYLKSVATASDEFLEMKGFDINQLRKETILFLPFNKGDPKVFAEGFSLLYRFDPKSRSITKLKARLICQRKCTAQFLSYQSSKDKTSFFYEATINGQSLKSTYEWKAGKMIPVYIDEPRALDALSRGHKAPPSVPVCQRSPAVIKEIRRRLKNKACERIDDMDLAKITFLAMDRANIEDLKPGDFSGLPNLTSIDLSHNPLKEISPGLFDGLFLLRSLNFQGCKLTTFPAGIFSHLGSLKNLYLNHNQISELPKDAFLGLSSLTFLSLNHNRLESLPAKVFAPLPKKRNIYLSNNPLKKRD